MQRQILVAVEEAFEAHQHSNEESNVWHSATVQLSQLYSRVFWERCDRNAWLPFLQYCAPPMTFGILLVRTTLRGLSDGCPCLPRLASSSISFALKNVTCLSGTPCFGPRLEIAIGFLECCRTPRVLQNSPATAINNPELGESIAISTLMFCRILAKFEDLCVVLVDE